MGPPSNAHRKIGEMLVEEGKITPSALVEALAEQKKQGTRLGEVLVHLKVLSEEEIIQSLARQMGTGCIDP
ncbi:MAG TPA: hypothetical protein VFG95_03730, partial [Nitrospiria bacterium]|nr:hypothetical protein [Nitrospiria bacterium]